MNAQDNSLNLTQKFAQLVIDQASMTQGSHLHKQLIAGVREPLKSDIETLKTSLTDLQTQNFRGLEKTLFEHNTNVLNKLDSLLEPERTNPGMNQEIQVPLHKLLETSEDINRKLHNLLNDIASQHAGLQSLEKQGTLIVQAPGLKAPQTALSHGFTVVAFGLGVALTLGGVWLKDVTATDINPAALRQTAPAEDAGNNNVVVNGLEADIQNPVIAGAAVTDKTNKYMQSLIDILGEKVTDKSKKKYLNEKVHMHADGMRIEDVEELLKGPDAISMSAFLYQAIAIKEGQTNLQVDGVLEPNGKTMQALRKIDCMKKAPRTRNENDPMLGDPLFLVPLIQTCANS